jgi:DNA replication initiation complex subunit (GINS family)
VNSGGIAYSQAQFAVDRNLTAEEYALINRLSEQVKAYSKHIGYEVDNSAEATADDLNIDPETGEVIEPLK